MNDTSPNSEPRTENGELTKPVITQREANQMAFNAGVAAEQAAKSQGVGGEDAATLLDAASRGIVIAGVKFPPLMPAFVLMQDRLQAFAKAKPILDHPSADCAATAFILHDPKRAWAMLRSKEPEAVEQFYEAVIDFGLQFTTDDYQRLFAWIGAELRRMQSGGESSGK